MNESITLDAGLIGQASDIKERRVLISVAASPFYTPDKARASFDAKGNLLIQFDYTSIVKRPKIENLVLSDDVNVNFDLKSGRVERLIIPKSGVPEQDLLHLKVEIEAASKNAFEKLGDVSNTNINRGSLNAALLALKEYSNDISQQAYSKTELLTT
jgi:hypothetical protein